MQKADELVIAYKELAYQNQEKKDRADELFLANIELAFQNKEKEKRAAELVVAKDNAQKSDRLKSAFLANMSHEIRTPMNCILGFTELLKETDITEGERQSYISIIQKSGARMLNVISNIVDISKIESGLISVSIKDWDVNENLCRVYDLFKAEVEAKGILFFLKNGLEAQGLVIKTDPDKIDSILTNLVKNAIKYTITGSIELGCEKMGNYLEFSVKDTGIGIPLNRQQAIFERFIKSDNADKRALQGAGLGLSITKAYVEMLGGRIWVESQEMKGSTFCFTIPSSPKDDSQHKVIVHQDDLIPSCYR